MKHHAQPTSAKLNSLIQAGITCLTPRQCRALDALVAASDWIEREQIDRIAGASNGPQIIMELRRKVTGRDGIDMERVDKIDRDGNLSKPGRYRLNELGRRRINAICSLADTLAGKAPPVQRCAHG